MTMTPLDPPFLEFAFYVGPSNAQEQAIAAVDAIVRAGGRFTGVIDLASGARLSKPSAAGLSWIEGAGRELRRIYVDNATRMTSKTEVVEIDRGVVLLRTEGEDVSGPSRLDQDRLYRLGTLAYMVFRSLVLEVDSYYGAICCEYSLEEPAQLKADPRSLAFRDFFVSRSAVSPTTLEAIRDAVGEAYLEEFGDRGLYVSMSPEFNPEHRAVEPVEAQYRSVRVAKLLLDNLGS